MNSLNNAGIFLISTLFDLYLFVLAVRLILAYSQANYFNPITQIIIRFTQPIVSPVRRILPTYKRIEFATLFWMIIFECLKIVCISLLVYGFPDISLLILSSLSGTLKLILNTFFYAILIQVILSWIQPQPSPATQLLDWLTAPIMRPLRRLIPPVGGLDITPIPALIILQLLVILLP